jgi:hypothetical protein
LHKYTIKSYILQEAPGCAAAFERCAAKAAFDGTDFINEVRRALARDNTPRPQWHYLKR